MTKELYNELRKEGLITKPYMTLDYINKHKLGLKDIITVPVALKKYSGNVEETVVEETVIEETVETVVEETVVEETVVEETVVEETVETVVEETVVEETKEEIVVDEPEVVNTPKTKGKKN